MRKPAGSVSIGKIKGVPIYLHWSFPAGAIIPMGYARFSPIPSLYLCMGYVFLVALHEVGHLAAARITKHHVFSIGISGAGGQCLCEVPRSLKSAALIYSGGLVAQLALLAIGILGIQLLDDFGSFAYSYFIVTCTAMNAAILLLNAIPIKGGPHGGSPTDGYVLWQLLKRYLRTRA